MAAASGETPLETPRETPRETPARLTEMASFLTSVTNSDSGKVTQWEFDEQKNEWDVNLEITSKKQNAAHLDLGIIGPKESIWFWTERAEQEDVQKRPVAFQTLFMDLEDGGSATVYMRLVNTRIIV